MSELSSLAEVTLPAGYSCRRFQPGEELVWAEVLNSTGELGEWTLERAYRVMEGPRRVVQEGIHFVLHHEDVAVATACMTTLGLRTEVELGWVAVVPSHQGKGLGYQVCLATLHYIRDLGYGRVCLLTDDHRLAAIKTYLRLGFRPEYTDESHPERWREVLAKVGWGGGAPVEKRKRLLPH